MPNRAERRKLQKRQEQEARASQKSAALQFERDMKRDGDYNAALALKSPFYMEQVVAQRAVQMQGMEKNGITKADLAKEYERGYADARRDVVDYYAEMFFAAVAIVLKREFKFGCGRIRRVFSAMYQIMTWEITTCDIKTRCLEETGVEIRMTDLREEMP